MSLLMRAAPELSADLFHAVPLEILDPFLYVEHDGRKVAVIGVLERDRIAALGLGIEVVDPFSLGLDTLLEQGVGFLEAEIEIDLRACRELGLESAIVPPDFPLAWADKLRARRHRVAARPRGVRPPPPPQDRRAAGGHPPRPGRRRRRDGRRRGAPARAPRRPHLRAGARAHAGGLQRVRRRAARHRDRRPRRRSRRPATRRGTARSSAAASCSSTSGRATRRRAAGRT